MAENSEANYGNGLPDVQLDVKEVFGLEIDMKVPGFSEPSEHVPEKDKNYIFDSETTLAILAGFSHNRRCMVQGYHGTGKSTHIEQVAARLNWPCIRVNLDSHEDASVPRHGLNLHSGCKPAQHPRFATLYGSLFKI